MYATEYKINKPFIKHLEFSISIFNITKLLRKQCNKISLLSKIDGIMYLVSHDYQFLYFWIKIMSIDLFKKVNVWFQIMVISCSKIYSMAHLNSGYC